MLTHLQSTLTPNWDVLSLIGLTRVIISLSANI